MASANLLALQKAINRFSGVAGFQRIAEDGGMGAQTAQAVLKAMGWVAADGCNGGICVADDTQNTARELAIKLVTESGAIDQTLIMQSAVGFTTFFNNAAATIGLSVVGPAPTTVTPKTPTFVLPSFPLPGTGKGFVTDLRDKWKSFTTAQQAGIGAVSLLVAWFVFTKLSGPTSTKSAAVTTGHRRR